MAVGQAEVFDGVLSQRLHRILNPQAGDVVSPSLKAALFWLQPSTNSAEQSPYTPAIDAIVHPLGCSFTEFHPFAAYPQ